MAAQESQDRESYTILGLFSTRLKLSSLQYRDIKFPEVSCSPTLSITKSAHMKKLLTLLVLCVTTVLNAQTPPQIKYQGVARDAAGGVISNGTITVQFDVHDVTPNGTIIYTETHAGVVTNQFGLFSLSVGSITPFPPNLFGSGDEFLEVSVDFGSGLTSMGTSQFLSVPYALHAETSGSSTPGPQGPTGANGAAGVTGAQGPSGDPGPTGAQGPIGNDGPTGPQGIAGATGPAGTNGANGVAGANGATGPTGANGTNGANGATGATGANGVAGANGATGPTGAAGTNGAAGATGPNGAAGTNGTNGATGPMGAAGATGPTGAAPTCSYVIGQVVPGLGGMIFYLDATGCHGLVCPTTDQSNGISWYNGTFVATSTTESALYVGEGNTRTIVRIQSAGSYAAKLCSDLVSGGFTDWYLPSKYELNLMYQNIGQGSVLGNVGGFAAWYYWCSSEVTASTAWYQQFPTGYQGDALKSDLLYVRAVRAF